MMGKRDPTRSFLFLCGSAAYEPDRGWRPAKARAKDLSAVSKVTARVLSAVSKGIKIPKGKQNICSVAVEHDCLDKDASIPVEDKVGAKAGSPAKARKRNLLSEKKSREQDQMRQISPLASRLLRTISIHHLEFRDYVLPDELTSDSETSTADVKSHETDSSASGEYVPLLPKAPDGQILRKRCQVCGTMNTMDQLDKLGNHLVEKQLLLRKKLTEAREALLKQKGRNAGEVGDVALQQSKEFQDMMELFNDNKEIFLRILQDPSYVLANYLQDGQASSAALAKSRSFPGAGLSGRMNDELFRSKHKRKESDSIINRNTKLSAEISPSNPVGESTAGGGIGLAISESATMDSEGAVSSFRLLPGSSFKLKSQRDSGTLLNPFKVIKQRIKDIIKEDKRERHRLSMDGILHKVPYGHKVSVNVKKEMQAIREGPGSDKANSISEFMSEEERISISNNYTPKFIRSHSLTESLDKYSRLLESISCRGVSERLPERSRLMQEAGDLRGRKCPKTLKRIFSLPELCSLSIDIQGEAPNEALPLELPTTGLALGNAAVDLYGSDEPKPRGTLVDMAENMESDTVVEQTTEVNASGPISGCPKLPALIDEQDQCETCSIPEGLTIPLHEQEIRNEVDPCDRPTDLGQIPFLNSYFQEDLLSPTKDSISEDHEMRLECIHYEGPDSSAYPQNQLGVDSPDGLGGSKAYFDKVQTSSVLTDISSFHVEVDQKDEAEFNFVRDVLLKSGNMGEVYLGAWSSPYRPVDPLLLEEAECSSNETDITGDESDMSIDHHLMFDLINMILLEIYDTSFACCPWIPRLDSRIRPLPVGHRVLEEVWANISWCLSYQPRLDPTIDCAVARDYAKDDGWMRLQSDSEDVAFEVEGMILDDLLDEVVLQLGELSDTLCVPS